jgi:DNA-binding beta-propeller fold protein YncE
MHKIPHLHIMLLVGVIVFLGAFIPATWQSQQAIIGSGNIKSTQAAAYHDYLYTITGTGQGSGNDLLDNPIGVAINGTGYVYIADLNNERVQVYDNAGNYQYTIGTTRESGFDNTHFNTPMDVTVDQTTGRVYVADYDNFRTQVFDNADNYLFTIDPHTGGRPTAIAVNSTGYIYIIHTHHVEIFDNLGN